MSRERILSDYLDTLIHVRSADRKGFAAQHPEGSPGRHLLGGEFRECVPVLGDEPCAWAFSQADVQKGSWRPADEGVPLASPWNSWFLDVRAPKRVNWGGDDIEWFGPKTWGWIVQQEERPSNSAVEIVGNKWVCKATLVLPQPNLNKASCATDWTVTWYLDGQGLGIYPQHGGDVSSHHEVVSNLPEWRTGNGVQEWNRLLTAPLWRTLQLFNVKDVKRVFQHPRRNSKGRKKNKKKQAPEISYCVLRIEQSGRSASGPCRGGTHASPAYHLRRGHFMNYGYHDRKGPDSSCSKCGGVAPHDGICGKGHFGRGKAVSIRVPPHTVGNKSRGERINIYSLEEEGEACAAKQD